MSSTDNNVRPRVLQHHQMWYQQYLPEQMSREELEKAVDSAITELGASGPADMGKVIGLVRQKTEGKADGAMIAEVAKAKLT